ncbi:MAG: type I glyceraldehyde-3-phosphate dehydrogenase [Thermaerobacter sp.]|nr:type I glyceraldehyde-3-phosphate dehydrogenase [Bacillota bacterium]REJ35752.1 MAG: type I glyceraldehyde-3-phosphate dehydrogenase [Bacillota bacterium]
MTVRVGINGFGSIGRRFFRQVLRRSDMEVVAVNDPGDPAALAHLLRYDSTYGRLDADLKVEDGTLEVNGRRIRMTSHRDAAEIAWHEAGVQVVVDCSGVYTDGERARLHIDPSGARKVVISAPAKNEDVTLCIGVNEDAYDPERHHVISNASCTTNCLAPVAKVLHQRFGIVRGLMTTVHAYTSDQRLLDNPHRDLRRARSAALNIIPTTTGAARAVGKVLPELNGRLNGFAMRVPVPTVSVVDLVAELEKPATAEEVNAAFKEAAAGPLKGILEVAEVPLVSSDFRGSEASAIVDAPLTMMMGDRMVKVVAWYDNEWGYSARLVDLVALIGRRGV